MNYPEFFNQVAPIKLFDPLADFLGAFEDGTIEISYLDCVKLAGHSCPTVAGAFIMTHQALQALFDTQEDPIRSQIKIEMHQNKDDGVTGVIGNVCAFICGAGDSGGFAGIGGKFSRKNLLEYGVSDVVGDIRFTRLDTKESVSVKLDTSSVAGSPEMMPLMQKALQGLATSQELKKFQDLWQGRVKTMLTTPNLWAKIAPITQKNI